MTYKTKTTDGKRIIYEESFWTGKKRITIDGDVLQNPSKKEFIYENVLFNKR